MHAVLLSYLLLFCRSECRRVRCLLWLRLRPESLSGHNSQREVERAWRGTRDQGREKRAERVLSTVCLTTDWTRDLDPRLSGS